MDSEIFSSENFENEQGKLSIQHGKMLRVFLEPGEEFFALKGSMVAYQGEVEFFHKKSDSVGQWMKKSLVGENTPLMTVKAVNGTAEVFFAKDSRHLYVIDLGGDSISINGDSILAFSPSLTYEVKRVKGAGILSGGLFNTYLSGRGKVIIATHGQPTILKTDRLTSTDINATVGWSAKLTPTIHNSMNMKSLLRGGTGEAFQYRFQGEGFVIIQPSESRGVAQHSHAAGGAVQ